VVGKTDQVDYSNGIGLGELMDRDEIRAKVQELLRDIVDDDSLQISDRTSASTVTWWDSLTHLRLLVAIEEQWKVAFKVAEVNAPEDVGQLIDMIKSKLPA
jgi:acyl carrier protein